MSNGLQFLTTVAGFAGIPGVLMAVVALRFVPDVCSGVRSTIGIVTAYNCFNLGEATQPQWAVILGGFAVLIGMSAIAGFKALASRAGT